MATNTLTGGAFQDVEGNVLALGSLVFELSHDSYDTTTGSQIVAGLKRTFSLDANGNVSGTIENNDQLSPAGSYYIVRAFKADGTIAWRQNQYVVVVSTTSPFNLNAVIPGSPN